MTEKPKTFKNIPTTLKVSNDDIEKALEDAKKQHINHLEKEKRNAIERGDNASVSIYNRSIAFQNTNPLFQAVPPPNLPSQTVPPPNLPSQTVSPPNPSFHSKTIDTNNFLTKQKDADEYYTKIALAPNEDSKGFKGFKSLGDFLTKQKNANEYYMEMASNEGLKSTNVITTENWSQISEFKKLINNANAELKKEAAQEREQQIIANKAKAELEKEALQKRQQQIIADGLEKVKTDQPQIVAIRQQKEAEQKTEGLRKAAQKIQARQNMKNN
jgi:hypothetical protein